MCLHKNIKMHNNSEYLVVIFLQHSVQSK